MWHCARLLDEVGSSRDGRRFRADQIAEPARSLRNTGSKQSAQVALQRLVVELIDTT